MQNFRDLHVWERAHLFALAIRRASRGFPRRGYAELKSQIVRAAESIPSNIVEGCGAATRKEFARFLDIAIKSTSEVEYDLILQRTTVCSGRISRTRCLGKSWRFGECCVACDEHC